jgi:hypothetical protein
MAVMRDPISIPIFILIIPHYHHLLNSIRNSPPSITIDISISKIKLHKNNTNRSDS